jgi:hypothetical protein
MYSNVVKYIDNFSIRLFIDNSIYTDKNIMKKLSKLSKLEIVLYDCPRYKIDNNYHQGLFGTIIRFFPMFNFPNNDANIVILSDIDDYAFRKYFSIFKILQSRLDDLYLIKFANAGRMFNNKELYNHIYNGIILDYIKPQEMVCLKQVDHNVMINFLLNLHKNIKYSYYLNYNLIKDDNYISKYMNNSHFIYGIDEYFLVNNYMHYIIDNKLPYVEILKYNVLNPLYYQINIRNEKWIDNYKDIFNKLLNRILKYMKIDYKLYIKINENEKFKIIMDAADNPIDVKIKLRIYKLFIKLRNNNKYRFLYNTIYNELLLSERYFGLYEFVEYRFLNTKFEDFFEKKKKFDEKYINILKVLYKKF